MSTFYSNETPSGSVNGVNKTFTTANNINTIITVVVDGAIYSGTITYTAGTTSFVLADAPTASITVSYFDAATGVTITDGIPISTLKTQFELRKKDISDVSNETFYQWCNQINKFLYNKVKGANFQNYSSSANYTVSSSPSTQALPSDFHDMSEDGCGLFAKSTEGDNTDSRLAITGFGRSDPGYYLSAGNIIFTGIDDSTTFVLRYLPTLASITALTDKLIVTEDKLWHLLNALDVCYTIWDDDGNSEFMADQRFVRSLDELIDNINPYGTAYQTADFTQSF